MEEEEKEKVGPVASVYTYIFRVKAHGSKGKSRARWSEVPHPRASAGGLIRPLFLFDSTHTHRMHHFRWSCNACKQGAGIFRHAIFPASRNNNNKTKSETNHHKIDAANTNPLPKKSKTINKTRGRIYREDEDQYICHPLYNKQPTTTTTWAVNPTGWSVWEVLSENEIVRKSKRLIKRKYKEKERERNGSESGESGERETTTTKAF